MITWAKIKVGFHHTMKQIYGDNYTFDKVECLRLQTLDGKFNWLPPVRYVDSDTLGGANAVYDAESETLLLNSELAGSDLAAQSIFEEVGNHLDIVLNVRDSSEKQSVMPIRTAYMEC